MKIALHSYATEWPMVYEYEKHLLLHTLDVPGLAIEHIGSTAVPGLSAKPVIDIMVGVPDGHVLNRLVEPLLSLGYSYIRYHEQFIPERRFFVRTEEAGNEKKIADTDEDYPDYGSARHTHHLHVVYRNSVFWRDRIKFREHLRNNPADRLVYELLKKQLAENEWESVLDYIKAKTSFIEMILSRP